jgi:methionyl-tRNA formyltransferase
MAPIVDSGLVIEERRFPIFPADSVASLKERTMAIMLGMFTQTIAQLAAGEPLPTINANWSRCAFTRRDLEALCNISPEMTAEEITRRARAVHFPGYPGARTTIDGVRFEVSAPAE